MEVFSREDIDNLVSKYTEEFDPNSYKKYIKDTQYDSRSAMINYAMVREFKPKTILEFGAKWGRCTFDMLTALYKNNKPFKYYSFEIDDHERKFAQEGLDKAFGDKSITIGGDVLKSELPKNIDYLFLDNDHDLKTTEWVFEYLLPNHCVDGCIVQIHDLRFDGDDWGGDRGLLEEGVYMLDLKNKGKLPLKKLYFTYEEGRVWESTWWQYQS